MLALPATALFALNDELVSSDSLELVLLLILLIEFFSSSLSLGENVGILCSSKYLVNPISFSFAL